MKKPPVELLESFTQFVESGSLLKAAEKLNMTQPALSMQLKRLEEFFEYPVFEFQGKKKALTPFGVALYEESRIISENVKFSFENLHRKFSSAALQTLRIGCRRELITKTSASINFAGAISFIPMSSNEAVEHLLANKIDLAISRHVPDSNEIIARKFFTSGSHVVVHRKWLHGTPISNFFIDRKKVIKVPSLVYGSEAELFREWVKFMKLDFENFKIKYACEDWVSLLQLVETGEGFSIMPDTVRSNLPQVEYFQIPRHLVPQNPHYYLYHKGLLKFPAFKKIFKE